VLGEQPQGVPLTFGLRAATATEALGRVAHAQRDLVGARRAPYRHQARRPRRINVRTAVKSSSMPGRDHSAA
jgi:hypothetical protein